MQRHIERMRQGLEAARIQWQPDELGRMSVELLAANNLADAFVYWQVTRGAPAPDEPVRTRVPSAGMRPTVFGYCTAQPPLDSFVEPPSKKVVTCEDRRWSMGHVKCTSPDGERAGVDGGGTGPAPRTRFSSATARSRRGSQRT